jgi:hypothetical protein
MVSEIYFGTKLHSFNIDKFLIIIISHLDTRFVCSWMYRVALHNKTDGHKIYCQILNAVKANSSLL